MLYSIVGLLVIILDQAVKYWVQNTLFGTDIVKFIPGVISLVNVHNDGAAFSFLSGSGARIYFIIATGVFTVLVIIALATNFISGKVSRWSLVLVTAGGLANCIDRVIYGYVQDMFKVELFNFAIFNVADVFITVFAIVFVLAMIFEKQIGIKLNITGCIGALALILTGVISEKDALKSIDLKTIFLFGGTLSLASALDKTGAGAEIANIVIGALGKNPSPYVLTLVVFLLCCVMTNFMSNTATTALMVPICLSIAQGMGADPRAVLMACVIGGSCAYATPIGMPANTMVVSAGGYTFKDYAKAGLPLILIATVVSMVILPIAFPFFPQ